ncbi:MAG: sigma-70 family RNA polymerase sigma factor [Planctomycetes bacterium]|nr:sigma-70 family RNA polymerase sigma factor [Planctomycetota bacterium]
MNDTATTTAELAQLSDEDVATMILARPEHVDRLYLILIQRYQSPLISFIRQIVSDPATAEDIFQETFLRVVNKISTYNSQFKFKTWLYTIAYRVALSHLRWRKKRKALSFTAGRDESPEVGTVSEETVKYEGAGPITNAQRSETKEQIEAAMDTLPREQREVFFLYQYQQMSYKEIADVLDCPLGTVKSRMHAAIEKLSLVLDKMKTE